MWWKEKSDKINKKHIQGDVFHFSQNAYRLKTMLCAQVKLCWLIQANTEILSVTKCRGKHFKKKTLSRDIKICDREFLEPRSSLFIFYKCDVTTGITTLSLTCQTSSTFCRFSLLLFALFALPGEHGLRRKRNEKYYLKVGYVLVRCLLF